MQCSSDWTNKNIPDDIKISILEKKTCGVVIFVSQRNEERSASWLVQKAGCETLTNVCVCVLFCSCATWGILCVTLACHSRRNIVPPFLFFRKCCVRWYIPALLPEQQKETTAVCFSASLAFIPFCEGKNRSTCGYVCLFVTLISVCLKRS